MKKNLHAWLALLLCLLTGFAALAETDHADDAAREIVKALLSAAAGTTYDDEQRLRAGLSASECTERSASLAEYRRQTLPWLCASLAQEMPDAQVLLDAHAALQECAVGRAYLDLLADYGFDDPQACMEGSMQACRAWLGEIDSAALSQINPDYTCWLYCPDSPIDYPVVQGADNSAYLHRLFNGEKNACGTLFIDCRNLKDFQDPNTLIYGHHMRNGSMFKSLTYYEDQLWYDTHPYMLLIAAREIIVLELFAGCTASKRDPCYEIALGDENDLLALAEDMKRRSDFASGVEISPGDRLVTLSTCAYAFEGARYIVMGRIRSLCPAEEM